MKGKKDQFCGGFSSERNQVEYKSFVVMCVIAMIYFKDVICEDY